MAVDWKEYECYYASFLYSCVKLKNSIFEQCLSQSKFFEELVNANPQHQICSKNLHPDQD